MYKTKIHFLLISIITLLTSCDQQGNLKEIEIDKSSSAALNQTIPSNTPTAQGISFTTKGAWSSDIKYENRNRNTETENWLSITPDHGDKAGNYTISIKLDENTTQNDRKAEIIIICGETRITITILQSYIPAEETPGDKEEDITAPTKWSKYIDKLTIKEIDRTGETTISEYTHNYDEQNRITDITEKITDGDRIETTTCYFDYSVEGEVMLTYEDNEDIGRGFFGANGYLETIFDINDYRTNKIYLTQDNNGFITSLTESYEGYTDYTTELEYSNGLLYKLDKEEAPIEKLYTNRYKNDKINIDINSILLSGYEVDPATLFIYTRMSGSLGNYIMEDANLNVSYAIPGISEGKNITDPNYKEHITYYTYDIDENEKTESELKFDSEDCPSEFKFCYKFHEYKHEHDLVAGEKVYEDEEHSYYRIDKINEQTTKTGVVKTHTTTYTFQYK